MTHAKCDGKPLALFALERLRHIITCERRRRMCSEHSLPSFAAAFLFRSSKCWIRGRDVERGGYSQSQGGGRKKRVMAIEVKERGRGSRWGLIVSGESGQVKSAQFIHPHPKKKKKKTLNKSVCCGVKEQEGRDDAKRGQSSLCQKQCG